MSGWPMPPSADATWLEDQMHTNQLTLLGHIYKYWQALRVLLCGLKTPQTSVPWENQISTNYLANAIITIGIGDYVRHYKHVAYHAPCNPGINQARERRRKGRTSAAAAGTQPAHCLGSASSERLHVRHSKMAKTHRPCAAAGASLS